LFFKVFTAEALRSQRRDGFLFQSFHRRGAEVAEKGWVFVSKFSPQMR